MDNKKFETLIDLIINEQEEKAQELFHEIVVEKSREIYESIMDEEMMDEGMHDSMEGQMVGEVGDLLDEIDVEEAGGMTEEEEEEEDLEVIDLDSDDMSGDDEESGEEAGEEDLEDRVESLEDKLEYLMAEFEKDMGGEEVVDSEEEVEINEEEMEEEVMEAVQLQKVSVTHGDNGSNTKSPALHEPKVKAAGVNPVKFSGHDESVPTGPKGPSNEYSKKEGELPGAGKFKNVPGGKAKVDLTAAPKPVTKDGSSNDKSPVAKG